jgi:single-strand DNA-binding protein
MADMNSIAITGNLTSDPRESTYGDNKTILSFRVANTVGWGDKVHSTFYDVTLFDKVADGVKQYLCKGKQVAVKGSHYHEKQEGKDGKVYETDVIDRAEITLLGPKSDTNAKPAATKVVDDGEPNPWEDD